MFAHDRFLAQYLVPGCILTESACSYTAYMKAEKIAGVSKNFKGHNPNPRVVSGTFRNLTRRVGSGRVRRVSSPHGSGPVTVTRPDPTQPDPTRPDPTREQSWNPDSCTTSHNGIYRIYQVDDLCRS